MRAGSGDTPDPLQPPVGGCHHAEPKGRGSRNRSQAHRGRAGWPHSPSLLSLSLRSPTSQAQLKAREPVTQCVRPRSPDQGQEEWAVTMTVPWLGWGQ